MATDRQLTANRKNAKLSTGPRSEQGKAKSSANALRHGLAARGLIVLPGQEDAFTELEAGLRDKLQPNGILQDVLFARLLESAWSLHRCRLAEAQLYLGAIDPAIDPLLDDRNEAKYARIQKYARQSESSMVKILRELGKLQTEHQYRLEAHPLTEEERNDPEEYDKTVHVLSPVCSVEQITAGLAKTGNLQKKAKTPRQNFQAFLEAFSAPPSVRPDFQFEANEPESSGAAAA